MKLKAPENIAHSYHLCNLPFPWKWFGCKYTRSQRDAFIYTSGQVRHIWRNHLHSMLQD